MRIRLFLLFTILVASFLCGICNAASTSIGELLKKAESGDPSSQFALAKKYFDGKKGVPQDYNEAVKWYTKAAEQGLADAQNNLGEMYGNAQGVPKDYNEAVKWFTRSAEQGYAKAQNNLGLMYYKSEGVPQDYNKAVKWFAKAAEQGHAKAQYNLSLMYAKGQGVPQNYDETVKWLTRAAAQGIAEAQFNLGLIYSNGYGVTEDYREAANWFTKAAAQGVPEAQFNIGLMYYEGDGVPQDYKAAAKWYTKAAAQGIAVAQYNLGLMYYKGDGVAKDYVESYKWFLLAAMNGNRDAQRLKEFLRTKMTSSQMEESQQRVNRVKKIKGFLAEKEKDSRGNRQIAESTITAGERDSKDNKQPAENVQSTSTGFLITSDGFILTACHSVAKAAKAEVLYDQKQYSAKVVFKDESTDFAVLKIDGNDFSYLPLASSAAVKTGDAVFTIGYPQVTLQGTEPKFTEGSISSLSGFTDNPRYFQISVPVQPGNSGGPLVNEKGQVVGIIVAKLSDVPALLITGSIPQNVNYALKSSHILPFIESIPDLSEKISVSDSVKDKSVVIEKTKKSVVLIVKYE